MKPITLTPGDMSTIIANLAFAQRQHEALAALAVGDERLYHENEVKSIEHTLGKLKECKEFKLAPGKYVLSWEEGSSVDFR